MLTYQKLLELKHKRADLVVQGKELLVKMNLEGHKALMADIDSLNEEIEAVEKQLERESQFSEGAGEPASKVFAPGQEHEADGYSQAVKSFAAAARAGFPKSKAAGDMMQEGVDADGGYTVPSDIVTKIIELREARESLLDEVQVIPVTTKSGRRTFKKRGQHQGFATVAEAAKLGKAATPQFTVLNYEV